MDWSLFSHFSSIGVFFTVNLHQCGRKALLNQFLKKGKKTDFKNYRPVCLTSSTRKVLERIVRSQLYSYLSERNLLTKFQHGFLEKKSTVTALSSTVPIWQKIIDSHGHVIVCYLDYRKAFDSINLDLLLTKLRAYGIEGCLLKFLQSFLIGRTQRVWINCAASDTYETPSGVSQGTCLGPLMFLLYINDLPTCLPRGVHCSIYADDPNFTVTTMRKIFSSFGCRIHVV